MGTNCWWGPGLMFGSPFGAILNLVFLGLILYGIFFLVSRLQSRSAGSNVPGNTALEILKRRYAAGEIDADEFERRKAKLKI